MDKRISSTFAIPGQDDAFVVKVSPTATLPQLNKKTLISYFDYNQNSGIVAGSSVTMSFFRVTLNYSIWVEKIVVHAFRLTSTGAVASIDAINVNLGLVGAGTWSSTATFPGNFNALTYTTQPQNKIRTAYNPAYGAWELMGPIQLSIQNLVQLTAVAYANWATTDQLIGGATIYWSQA